MTDWDGARYDRVSDPQVAWGRRVIDRLAPRAGERILDLGCGSARLTVELAARLAGGAAVGVDRSASMLAAAALAAPASVAAAGGGRLSFVRGDGLALPFAGAFDAVFSTATFHWVADHETLFRSIYGVLRPGGRLVAQCGGGRNLERLYGRAARLMQEPPFAGSFRTWRDPWHFSTPHAARAALERAGFAGASAWLESAPASFRDREEYAEFVACVCLRHHLDCLPAAQRSAFVDRLTRAAEADEPPLTLDYWRLNLDARRPRA